MALETASNGPPLRAGSISFWGAFAISFGNMAPAASVLFLPQAMAQFTGTAVPLAFVFAMIAAFLTSASILHFAKRFASSGAAYTFNTMGFGKVFGFLSGWMLWLAYGLALPSNLLVFGYFAQGFIAQLFGTTISWMVFALFALAAIAYLAVRGIRSSARVDLALGAIETAIILGLALAIVFQGGAHGNTWAVFSPANAPGSWVGIVFGMLYGVGAFAGFEASATVAEEVRNRFKTIPAAIFLTLIIGGALYVLVSYAIAIGYGANSGSALAQATSPLSTLAIHFVGRWMALLVDLAAMASALGISLASANASARVLYKMGSDQVVSRWFAATHKRYATPHHATLFMAALGVLIIVGLGTVANPYPEGFSYLVAAADVLGLTLYVSVNLAWVRVWWKDQQHHQMGVLVGVVPSILGAVVMLIPLVSTIYPIPMWPLDLALYLTFAYVAVGLVIAFILKVKYPQRLAQAGQVFAANDTLEG